MFWILHGEDEFRRSEFLAQLKKGLGDPAWVDLNTTILDGRRASFAQLVHAADAVPLLGAKRLVIVEDLLTRLSAPKKGEGEGLEPSGTSSRQFIDSLREYLPRLPDSTLLVFVESQALSPNHPLRGLVGEGAEGQIQEFRPFSALKKEGPIYLAQWIRDRAKAKKIALAPEAVQVLAAFIGYDLRLLDQELEKLSAYVGPGKKVTTADVRQLVSSVREADIFDMVDALGQRDVGTAATLLHQMLDEGKPALYLLTMIVRQFRLLIQVKELALRGLSAVQISHELKMHEFVTKKSLSQAKNFSFAQLRAIYELLATTDEAIKTGRLPETLALDLAVATICQIAGRQKEISIG